MKYLILCILFISCSKEHSLFYKNNVYYLKDVEVSNSQLKEIDWDVGKKKDKNISKGFRFSVGLPMLTKDARKTLGKEHGIDSWLYRVSRLNRGMKDSIGFLYFKFENTTRTSKYFTVSIYYTAAAVSKGFRLFHCPAFSHRKKITDLQIKDIDFPKKGNIYVQPIEKIPAAVTRLRFAPMVVNGGVSVKGDYLVEYALYNSLTKNRFSSWHKADGIVQILDEDEITLPSCIGVKEEDNPLPSSKLLRLEDLRIRK